ncbi:MAG: hypothetical protein WC860_03990 [Candidatus Margulisiibacteriota bacterium]
MNKKYLFFILMICSFMFLSSCFSNQSNETATSSNLTVGEVKRQIVKDKTSQSEILQLFGSPNMVTKNKDGNEVWAYNKMSYQTNASASSGTLIFLGGSQAMSSAATKSFDLIITFNNKDIVKDYNMVYSSY